MLMILLAAVGLFVAYWVIRSAVHHGILDAEESRTMRERRATEERALRELTSRYVEPDPDV